MVILGTNCSLNLYLICVVDLMHRKYERKGGSKMTLNIFVQSNLSKEVDIC
jgi:hypothetical protein